MNLEVLAHPPRPCMTPEWPCHPHAQWAKEPGDKDFPSERTIAGLRRWQKTRATLEDSGFSPNSTVSLKKGEPGRGTDDTTELQRQALSTIAVDSQIQEPETYKVHKEPRLGVTSSGMVGVGGPQPCPSFLGGESADKGSWLLRGDKHLPGILSPLKLSRKNPVGRDPEDKGCGALPETHRKF